MSFTQTDNKTIGKTNITFTHIRHATSILEINNLKILIDPMLSEKESLPPVILTKNKLKNPRVGLPINVENIIKNTDYILLTHLHFDHFDKKAIEILPKSTAIICSEDESKKLKKLGFSVFYPIESEFEINDIKIKRFPAVHGRGVLKFLMGQCSSFLIEYNEFRIFLTGDCILNKSLKDEIINSEPDILVANAGSAKFKFGKSITMSIKDIKEISDCLKNTNIYVVHLESLNHCTETRSFCKEQTQNYTNIYLPNDGEVIEFNY